MWSTKGRGSWWIQGVAKPLRRGWKHGRDARRVRVGDEEGTWIEYRHGCGDSTCGLCHAVMRADRGPLCGFTASDGSRCFYWYGHTSPGDTALCPNHVYDHLTLTSEAVPALLHIVGFDPFAPEPAKAWLRDGPLKWNDALHPWTTRPEVKSVVSL